MSSPRPAGLSRPAGPAGAVRRQPWFSLRWDDVDRMPVLVWAAGVGVLGAVLLGLAGLPPANLHGPLHRIWGIMDPLCGGTRAVYWMARGRVSLAWAYNPGTFLLPLFAAIVYARALYGRLTGRWLIIHVRRWLLAALTFGFLLMLEVNQQSHAVLLLRT